MQSDDYAQFLPPEFRERARVAPASTWWQWRGRRVHIARAEVPEARLRVLVLHGGGGHSGALWPLAAAVAPDDVELLAVDLPLYGATVEPNPRSVRYGDWIELVCDLVRAETARDPRPLMLFGASMGGMLAYEAASRTGAAAHVLATCLLDPADPAARRAAARTPIAARLAPALAALEPLLGGVMVPMRLLGDLGAMSANAELTRFGARDPRGGGARVPLGFMASFLSFEHTAPARYTGPPVTLVHPAEDAWTPPALSLRVLERIAAPTEAIMLEGCGHFPVEQPGLDQLAAAMLRLRDTVPAVSRSTSETS
ncbi:alpha/beta hydrolase [Nocardia harenae]|uniref:alpha/beta hydrolase n=1 Tax=Nocardia harenae TaxID=358707 RepID=UPI0008312D80|nr:alpha/beta fold hydrolase [Nocardia harenae]